jgi:hypothetical protein
MSTKNNWFPSIKSKIKTYLTQRAQRPQRKDFNSFTLRPLRLERPKGVGVRLIIFLFSGHGQLQADNKPVKGLGKHADFILS